MSAPLERREAVARLLAQRGDCVVVTGLGAPTYDVAAAGDTTRNFYLWGAMGGAAMVGLGLALAQPDTSIVVVTGDGEMLMGLGAFATIAAQQPPNLTIVVLDNGAYGETGGQPSHTSLGVDLAAVARGAGIAECDACDVVRRDRRARADARFAGRRAACVRHPDRPHGAAARNSRARRRRC